MEQKNQQRAYLLAFLAIAFWSTMATAYKVSLQTFEPLSILLFASFISLICISIILSIKGEIKNLLIGLKANWYRSVIAGFLNPFLYYVVLIKAYEILPGQEALTLNYVWPISLVVFSAIFLGQKLKLKSIFALTISLFGVFIITTHGQLLSFKFTNAYGDALALGSSIAWAGFWIVNLQDKRADSIKLFWAFVFGFIFTALLFIIQGKQLPEIWNTQILSVVWIGAFDMGITFFLWLTALRLSQTNDKISQLVFLSPFISLFILRAVTKEELLLSTFIGLAFIIGGILLQQYKFAKR